MDDKPEHLESLIKLYARSVERMIGLAVLAVIAFIGWRLIEVNWIQDPTWIRDEDLSFWTAALYLGIPVVFVLAVGRAVYYAGAIRGARTIGKG